MAYFNKNIGLVSVAALAATLAWVPPASAGGDDAILQLIEEMQAEIDALREQVRANGETADEAREIAEDADQTADAAYSNLNSDTSWHLAGYAKVGFEYSDTADPNSTFIFGSFNPIFHFQYKDWVMAEAEVEFEMDDAETEVQLEYATFDFFVNDNVTIVVGKYWNPTTVFNTRLHPSWINRLTDHPAGFDVIEPKTDVGVMVRGGVPLGDMRLDYAFAVGNGHRLTEDGVDLHGFATDDNDNKSFSGRLGFLPIPAIEVGISFLTEELESAIPTGNPGAGSPLQGDFNMYAADAAYVHGPWRIRGEYAMAELDGLGTYTTFAAGDTLAHDTDWDLWYVEGAYRLSGLTEDRFFRNIEPVVRYGEYTVDGRPDMEEASESRINVGVNYWFTPSIVLHSVIEWRDFADDGIDDETLLQMQLGYGF